MFTSPERLPVFQAPAVPSSPGPNTEDAIFASHGEISFQEVLGEDFLPQYQDSTPSTSKDALDPEARLDEQQRNLLQEADPAGPGASLHSMSSSQDEELLSPHCPPLPTMAAAVCLMVEDPYFESEEAPKDSSPIWGSSCDFNIPSVHLNDQDLDDQELSAAPAGK